MPGALRSLLFVPGHRARFYEKLAEFRPDAVIVDLEDAVPPAEKALAPPSPATTSRPMSAPDRGPRGLQKTR